MEDRLKMQADFFWQILLGELVTIKGLKFMHRIFLTASNAISYLEDMQEFETAFTNACIRTNNRQLFELYDKYNFDRRNHIVAKYLVKFYMSGVHDSVQMWENQYLSFSARVIEDAGYV